MQEQAIRPDSFARFVDEERGLIERKIFVDEDIYQQELQKIFGRCWLYLAHESEVPNRGDFVSLYMGEESVILCRGPNGKLSAFINSCRHRGNRVCRTDRGNIRNFVCAYHGWSYNLSGELIGVPGKKDLYHDEIDQNAFGLIPVAHIDSYNGLIFATFDPEAPPLEEFLGDMRWGLDIMLGQGDLIAVGGVVRWTIEGNWKFAADNAIGDFYHGPWTHRSALLAAHTGGSGAQAISKYVTSRELTGLTLITEYGHGLNADYTGENEVDWSSPLSAWRKDPSVVEHLGPVRSRIQRSNMNVFPNLFVNSGSRDLMIRHPRGPNKMEIWKTVLVDRNADPEVQRLQVQASNRHFGPAGMFEQDDGENWSQSTEGARGVISQDYPLHYAMALGKEEFITEAGSPPFINTLTNEHAQLWMYKCWSEYMDAENWPELIKNHSSPGRRV